jgi:hypothetical protein
MLPHSGPPGLGVAVGVAVSPGEAVKTGVPPVGGEVGATEGVTVAVGEVWMTGVSVAVAVTIGDGGNDDVAVGVGPPDAVKSGGVGVGVPGRPAEAGPPFMSKAKLATTASATRRLGLPIRMTSWSLMATS